MKSDVGILLLQLGTPDAPYAGPVRRYLSEFLTDPRVIEVPRVIWWPLLNGIILTTRPWSSAKKYRRVWDKGVPGSPLRYYSQRQQDLVAERFPQAHVRYAMTYGNPQIKTVVKEMLEAGVERIIVLPMFPQYSATTTAACTDMLFRIMLKVRHQPSIRIVPPYYLHPAYLDALKGIIQENREKLPWSADYCVLSYHGIPKKYAQKGDPYATQVSRTTRALTERLGWKRGTFIQTYQSRFGPAAWLKPYTDDTLERLAHEGKKKVFVAMPGFTADCLETIDEIGYEALEEFHEAGGEDLVACPCLNDDPRWIDALEQIIHEEGAGWIPKAR
ncbi:ferrochelatase [Tuwongella immobilis]|uniref:Ferrochelatase n=1 Tax=Tuwongella immobilis TaxID=692036 RepID=A0A6C2YPP4_9BACT|nr:ferrochelatase [Tuwongella immobilis]VIP03281.1 ferrochelatase : Ferrochelatase OS=Ahrensia sp. R2A130 GN=hemH PE=3 SV=1: Ferrochelatase [Tuwongella immobilis]VTS03930.1 ferrochelatase : Ferrochelatase OS=Ahrensia sp. R2A130 GN=hemH PE=3 SV=1: Ferrochelatase [Tuwongella immobilis]